MKAPVCSINATSPTEQRTPPVGSKIATSTTEYYNKLAKEGGVLNTSQQLEVNLQRDFVSSVSNLASAVPTLGAYNRIESALSTLLAWKRYLWQNTNTGFDAGLVRQTLVERSTTAAEMVRMLAVEKSLPLVKQLRTALANAAPNLPATRVNELLHDQIVVGNHYQLLNVLDSPIVHERLYQRAQLHNAALVDAGLSQQAIDNLQQLSVQISNTFDEMRKVAGNSGFNIDLMANGGYFPLRATAEFERFAKASNEQWLSGFKSVQELVQKQRKTNAPVVVDIDHLASLMQSQLLGVELGGKSLADLSRIELELVAKQATVAEESAAQLQEAAVTRLAKEQASAAKSLGYKRKLALAKARELLVAKNKTAVTKYDGELKLQGYTPKERKAAVALRKQELQAKVELTLEEVNQVWDARAVSKQEQLATKVARETKATVESLYNSQSKEVQKLITHEQAKLALLEINANPGLLSQFLATKFSEGQLKRLFEGGYLASFPAMTDELMEFYRGLDMGVRGLADAIVLDPVEAIKNYANELSEAVAEQQLFKTVFDQGAGAGWVKPTITPAEAKSYIRVGNSPKLRQYLESNRMALEVGDMYIHRTAADQLDALLKINTNPAQLQMAAQVYQQFTTVFRRSLIIGGADGYMKRVFVQNIISLAAVTQGSLLHLPFAMVDVLRNFIGKSWDVSKNQAKVYQIGNESYSHNELYRELAARRGGFSHTSLGDRDNFFNSLGENTSKEAKERLSHFNKLYVEKFGHPLTGAFEGTRKNVGDTFNKAYKVFALGNQLLDNAARWAAVRDLAANHNGKFANLDELLREVDTYFGINADAGAIGNALGSSFMPFAQFAINAPGSALRHAINHPWRMANTMQLYSQAASSNDLTEAELPPWLRNSEDYFFSLYRDPNTGKHGVVMPQGVDFMLDSYTWMTKLVRDLAGNPMSTTAGIREELDDGDKLQRYATEIMSKSYLFNVGLAILGLDPRSLKPYDKSEPADTVMGIPVTTNARSLITSLFPIVRRIDQSLPAAIVGQAPAVGSGGGFTYTKDAGTPSLFGATPTTGGARREKNLSTTARVWEALTGVNVSEIDPQRNIISTYKDFTSQAREIRTTRMALYRKMQTTTPTASDRERFEQLKQLEVVLWLNKARIDKLAARKGMTPPVYYETLQGTFDELLTQPLSQDVELEILQNYNQEP
jgi:hypothetical protein